MPKFKHGDRVIALPESSSPYGGKTGITFSKPRQRTVAPAAMLDVASHTVYQYRVYFEDLDDDVRIMESDLALAPD